MIEKTENKMGSFHARITASVIDLFILLLALLPLSNILNVFLFGEETFNALYTEVSNSMGGANSEALYRKLIEANCFSKYIILNLITLSFTMVYFLVFWIKCDTSPGKWLMGLKIVDEKTGRSPTIGQYFIRIFSYFLSALPLMIGFIMINYSKTRQGLHDKIAGTYVLHFKRDYSVIKEFLKKLPFRRQAR